MSGRFDACAVERRVLAALREYRVPTDSRHEQDSSAVAFVSGVLRVVAESEQGARRTAEEAAAARALVAFHAEVWAQAPVTPAHPGVRDLPGHATVRMTQETYLRRAR